MHAKSLQSCPMTPSGPANPAFLPRARSPRVSGTPPPFLVREATAPRGHCEIQGGGRAGAKWGPSLRYPVQAPPLLGCPAPGRPRTPAGRRVGRAARSLAQQRPRCPALPRSSAKASSPRRREQDFPPAVASPGMQSTQLGLPGQEV